MRSAFVQVASDVSYSAPYPPSKGCEQDCVRGPNPCEKPGSFLLSFISSFFDTKSLKYAALYMFEASHTISTPRNPRRSQETFAAYLPNSLSDRCRFSEPSGARPSESQTRSRLRYPQGVQAPSRSAGLTASNGGAHARESRSVKEIH